MPVHHLFRILSLVLLLNLLGPPACGAADEPHWAFRLLARPAIPSRPATATQRTPIDRFLLARLHEQRLDYSPEADRVTLCRRAFLDLIGLPPSPVQVDEFLSDNSPDAFERLLDRLLASPHFGERWGRHWLDVVGYTDTVGFDIDANNVVMSQGKWRYRHYVINAFNADKPYNRFVQEQVAGDELVDWRHAAEFTPHLRESLIATGFLRTAQDFTHEPESNIELNKFAVLHDTIEIVGTSLLGLTLQCARCHDHKFDPVTQADYYRLMGLLTPAYNPQNWKPVLPWKPEIVDRGLPDVAPVKLAEWRKENEQLDTQIESCRQQIAKIRSDRKAELSKSAASESDSQPKPEITDQRVTEALTAEEQKTIAELNQTVSQKQGQKRTWSVIQALYDVGPPPETHLLNRGDHRSPGEVIAPGFIASLSPVHQSPADPRPGPTRERSGYSEPDAIANSADSQPGQSSGRRKAFADWLTVPDNPSSALLVRVMTNRVTQHLLGRGLVPTPENFGVNGEPPTHRELFEWLCSDFVHHDWRFKPLIRQLMSSNVYRQASRPPESIAVGHPDPGNQLWWRMPMRQLDAEVIRDSILTSTGELSTDFGGPPVRLISQQNGLVIVDEKNLRSPSEKNRRSVYLMFRRANNLSLLTVFDEPFIATTCSQRSASVVVSQSLTTLNDAFLFQQSEKLAARVMAESSADPLQQVEQAFRLVLARLPNDRERESSLRFLAEQTKLFSANTAAAPGAADKPIDGPDLRPLAQLCHALFNTSEFLYAE